MSDMNMTIIQQPLVNVYKWYRSNQSHIAVMIVQVPLEKLYGSFVRVWCHDGGHSFIEHDIKYDGDAALRLEGDVFNNLSLKYYKASGCLFVQLCAKKRSKATKAEFFMELDLGYGNVLQSSCFQVKSKFKGFTVKQMDAHCSKVKEWHQQIPHSLLGGLAHLPILPVDVLEPLRQVAQNQRRQQRANHADEREISRKRSRRDSVESFDEDQRTAKQLKLIHVGDVDKPHVEQHFFHEDAAPEDTMLSTSLSSQAAEFQPGLEDFEWLDYLLDF